MYFYLSQFLLNLIKNENNTCPPTDAYASYGSIYNSKYDRDDSVSNSSSTTTTAPILSSSSTYSISSKAYQNHYYNNTMRGF